MPKSRLLVLAVASAVAASSTADTLVLRSGSRVEGDLVEVRGSTIEFAENGGSTRRYDRSDVARVLDAVNASGIPWSAFGTVRDTLDDVFVHLVGRMDEGVLKAEAAT